MQKVTNVKTASIAPRSTHKPAVLKVSGKPSTSTVSKPKDSFERGSRSTCSGYSMRPQESFECRLEGVAKKLGGKAGSAAAVAIVRAAVPAATKLADVAIQRLDAYIDKNGCN